MDEANEIPTRRVTAGTAVMDTGERPSIPPTPRPLREEATNDPGFKNPLEHVTVERPGTHPIAYAALAIAALALLLSLLSMGNGGSDKFREVRIGNQDCVIGRQGDADVLYCRAAAVPPT
jgi:hypothetical protein